MLFCYVVFTVDIVGANREGGGEREEEGNALHARIKIYGRERARKIRERQRQKKRQICTHAHTHTHTHTTYTHTHTPRTHTHTHTHTPPHSTKHTQKCKM